MLEVTGGATSITFTSVPQDVCALMRVHTTYSNRSQHWIVDLLSYSSFLWHQIHPSLPSVRSSFLSRPLDLQVHWEAHYLNSDLGQANVAQADAMIERDAAAIQPLALPGSYAVGLGMQVECITEVHQGSML